MPALRSRKGLAILGVLVVTVSACGTQTFESDGSDPTVLEETILAGDESKVRELLNDGMTFDSVNAGPAIAYAVWSSDPQMIRYVASRGARLTGNLGSGVPLSFLYLELDDESVKPAIRSKMLEALVDVGLSPCPIPENKVPSETLRDLLKLMPTSDVGRRLAALEKECRG